MNAFLIGLQFLTRVKLVRQEVWEDRDFGASVAWFPLVGLVIGGLLCAVYAVGKNHLPLLLLAVLLVIAEFLITGGLHADGLMDTCDGYFSGRSQERCLEIMKDSRVGSNGVVGFVFLVLLKVAAFYSLWQNDMYLALLTLPIISRWLMTYTIVRFPYARPTGIGKAFAAYAPSYALTLATVLVLLPLAVFTIKYAVLLVVGFLWMQWVNRSFVRKLGGVTGDTYGAMSETAELIMLLFIVIMENWPVWHTW